MQATLDTLDTQDTPDMQDWRRISGQVAQTRAASQGWDAEPRSEQE